MLPTQFTIRIGRHKSTCRNLGIDKVWADVEHITLVNVNARAHRTCRARATSWLEKAVPLATPSCKSPFILQMQFLCFSNGNVFRSSESQRYMSNGHPFPKDFYYLAKYGTIIQLLHWCSDQFRVKIVLRGFSVSLMRQPGIAFTLSPLYLCQKS